MTTMAPEGLAFISVRSVDKTFRRRGQAPVTALRDVSLDIERGEFVTLLGPSGCGKSTLLRLIGGLHEPDSGAVLIGPDDARTARAGRQFSLVPQSPALVPWKTVAENVRFLSLFDRDARVDDAAIDALLESVGLADVARSFPHELSGGMQQRVSLVRAFALGAPILLMDEPFAALDEITRADMRYVLLELWQRTRATVVFVTHSVTEAVILSDRVLVMASRPGQIAADREITLPRPRTPAMEDGQAFHDLLRALRADLREHHVR